MTYNNLKVSVDNKIATVYINRPKKLNALNRETIEELGILIDQFQGDDQVKVIVISGSGDKAFVAGADIAEFADFSKEEGEALARNGQEQLFDKLANYSKIVIAAINGYALGGGLELAMAAHIRIASENAMMGLPEVSLGLIPGYGGTQRLAQLIGKGRALELISSAKMIDATTAEQWGLVSKVTPKEELLDTAVELAFKIARNSSSAINLAIQAVNASNSPEGYDREIELFGACFDTEDFKEGTQAFLSKRKPKFN